MNIHIIFKDSLIEKNFKNLVFESIRIEIFSIFKEYRDIAILNIPLEFFTQVKKLVYSLGLEMSTIKYCKELVDKLVLLEIFKPSISIVVARNFLTILKLFNLCKPIPDYRKIFLMMGYPKCCCNSLCSRIERGEIFPLKELYYNKKNINPILNIIYKPIGIYIIPFIPCSLNCREAIRESKKYLFITFLKDELLSILSLPFKITSFKNELIIENSLFTCFIKGIKLNSEYSININ